MRQPAYTGLRRSHYRVAPPLIYSTPDSLTCSVRPFLKRRCDRTLGLHPRAGRARRGAHPRRGLLRGAARGRAAGHRRAGRGALSRGRWRRSAAAPCILCRESRVGCAERRLSGSTARGQVCCDAAGRVSIKPFEAQVFVAVSDLSEPGRGQTHILSRAGQLNSANPGAPSGLLGRTIPYDLATRVSLSLQGI
jgi:hypothetical protein